MIIVSEIGDKTFLIAALMAMSHDRAVVFAAAFGALLVMSVLSAGLGHAVPHLSTTHAFKLNQSTPSIHVYPSSSIVSRLWSQDA
jgi:putative Ca2+/H+ antiporter (TMEM165/GDT1 family)